MTYYEELGLDASASLEQIREAYLYLARLLHPDQQQDEDLRRLAEAQMKRVNHIYEVLSDPDRRRRYDSELERQNAEPAVPRIVPAPKHARTRNFGTVVWLASALLGLAGIYWYVSREASVGTPFSAAPYITQAKEQAAHSAPAADPIVRPAAPEPRARAKEDTSRTAQLLAELIDLQLQLKGATAERDRALQQVARQKTEIEELNRRLGEEREKGRSDERSTVPAPAAPAMPVTAKSDQAVRGRFAGKWFYVRPKTAPAKSSFYPPAFIEAVIVEEDGSLRGRYRARYEVPDKAISPDVLFYFEGKPAGGSANLQWNGDGGARGEVQLTLLSESSLQVVWSAKDLGKYLGLSAGTAVLVRKPEP